MKSYECRKCGESKPEGQMRVYAGKVSRICKVCPRGNGDSRQVALAADPGAAVHVVDDLRAPPEAGLVVYASYGFTARAEEGRLILEQPRDDGEVDQIILSKAEAGALIDWIEAQA